MRWLSLVFLMATACDKPAQSPTGGGKAPPKAQPTASAGAEEDGIVPPPDKPGYEKPE